MRKFYLLIFIQLIISSISAQSVTIGKAINAIQTKRYEKAIGICEKGIAKDRSLIELNYIKAWAEFEIAKSSKDPNEVRTNTKNVLRSLERAEKKDETLEFKTKYQWLYRDYSKFYMIEALDQYNRDRFANALPLFQTCYDLSKDTIAFTHIGLCHWFLKENAKAGPYLTKAAVMMYGAWQDSVNSKYHKHTYNIKVYQELANYYANEKKEDSSFFYVEMGLDMFPKDIKLTRTIVKVIDKKVREMQQEVGLNAEVLRWINRGLSYEINNEYFLQSQNNYFVQKLNYLLSRNDLSEAKLFDSAFYQTKKSLVLKGCKSKNDEFLLADSAAFVNACLKTFMEKNNSNAIIFYFYKWYPITYKTQQINEKGLEAILKNPPTFISRRLLYSLYNHAVSAYPKNANFKEYRFQAYSNWLKSDITGSTWDYLFKWNDGLVKDFPTRKVALLTDREKLLVKAIDTFTLYGKMETVWGFYQLLKKEYPKNLLLDSLNKKIALKDFEVRYKNTRIYSYKRNNETLAATGWKGISKRCEAGEMPDSTIEKVTDRINYFRTAAGVRDLVRFSQDKGEFCQEASVMYAPVGVFTREPTPETHICFTQGAAEAARYAQVVKDNNPAIAATVLVSDQKSQELYNRQYILAPNAKYFGFGASENNSVFWMVAPGEKLADSSYYQKNFISWPPQGYCPNMLMFEKWSFSMYGDLKDAKIEVSAPHISKMTVSGHVEQSPMLPFSTLVFDPNIRRTEFQMLPNGEKIDIKITLKNKKVYSYSVKVLKVE